MLRVWVETWEGRILQFVRGMRDGGRNLRNQREDDVGTAGQRPVGSPVCECSQNRGLRFREASTPRKEPKGVFGGPPSAMQAGSQSSLCPCPGDSGGLGTGTGGSFAQPHLTGQRRENFRACLMTPQLGAGRPARCQGSPGSALWVPTGVRTQGGKALLKAVLRDASARGSEELPTQRVLVPEGDGPPSLGRRVGWSGMHALNMASRGPPNCPCTWL